MFGAEIFNDRTVIHKSKFLKDNIYSGDIATKSFEHNSRSLCDFLIEILTYKLIVENESDHKKYISEFIGFILNDDSKDPYFGTIVIKWYNMGDLYEYANDIEWEREKRILALESDKTKCWDLCKMQANQSKKEIDILFDLANQIAIGNSIMIFFLNKLFL